MQERIIVPVEYYSQPVCSLSDHMHDSCSTNLRDTVFAVSVQVQCHGCGLLLLPMSLKHGGRTHGGQRSSHVQVLNMHWSLIWKGGRQLNCHWLHTCFCQYDSSCSARVPSYLTIVNVIIKAQLVSVTLVLRFNSHVDSI